MTHIGKLLAASVVACLCVGASPALAQDQLLQDLAKCTAVPDAAQRVACYDALAPQIRARTAAKPQDLTKEDQKSLFGLDFSNLFGPSKQTTPQQFGQERIPESPPPPSAPAEASKPETVDTIAAGVSEYSLTPLGRFVVFLDNGQIWRQIDGDTGRANFKRAAADNKITISRGAFGSYNLQLNSGNAIFKVRRVK